MDERLKRFYEQTVKDPLLAAEGLDLESMTAALDALEEEVQKLEDEWAKSKSIYRLYVLRYPFKKCIHPVPFLRAFVECERARRIFMLSPTKTHAADLIEIQKKAATCLARDIVAFRKAHEAILQIDGKKADTNTYFYFIDRMVTLDEVFATLDLLYKNAVYLKEEVSQRERLLQEEQDDTCVYTELRCEPIPEAEEGAPLTDEYRYLLQLQEEKGSRQIKEKYGPIYYTLNHYDERPTTHQFYVYLKNEGEGDAFSFWVRLADRYYFVPLDDNYSFHIDVYIYKPLMENGIPYWCQDPTFLYTVRDASFYADLATIVDLKRRPNFNKQYVRSQKSSLLDALIWTGVWLEKSHVRIVKIKKIGNVPQSSLYLLLARSYPSLYYLSFNASVWRLRGKKPNFKGSMFGTGSAYVTYEDIKEKVDADTLKRVMSANKVRSDIWNRMLAVHAEADNKG